MSVLSVRLHPINVKTDESNECKLCVGPHMTPGKVYGCSEFQKVVSKSFRFFKNFEIAQTNIIKSANFCLLLFYIVQREPSTMIYVGFIIKIISIYF